MMAPAQVPKVGFACTNSLSFLESILSEQLEESARLAAGNHQAVETVEVFRIAHEHDFRSQFFQPLPMRVKIAL